jgi:hypothetical protein
MTIGEWTVVSWAAGSVLVIAADSSIEVVRRRRVLASEPVPPTPTPPSLPTEPPPVPEPVPAPSPVPDVPPVPSPDPFPEPPHPGPDVPARWPARTW